MTKLETELRLTELRALYAMYDAFFEQKAFIMKRMSEINKDILRRRAEFLKDSWKSNEEDKEKLNYQEVKDLLTIMFEELEEDVRIHKEKKENL